MRFLVVEDDRELAQYIRRHLEEEGNLVEVRFDGAAGLRAAEQSHFDAIVLDLMLPFMNGVEVIKRLRLQCIWTPILMLTARDAPEDVVTGLDAGADDYLSKPFSLVVLLARLRAATRRSTIVAEPSQLRAADLVMDVNLRQVWRDGKELHLTRTEFAILECLLREAPRVVLRDRIVELVWNDREINSNNLDVFVRFLRMKVEPPGTAKLIQTERGLGYMVREAR